MLKFSFIRKSSPMRLNFIPDAEHELREKMFLGVYTIQHIHI